MLLKTLVLSAGLALSAMSASAVTITTDCGTIANGAGATCGPLLNLAVNDTQFAFEAEVADGASSGSLTVNTFVDPLISTALAGANVLVELALDYSDYDSAVVTLMFGANSTVLSLVPNSNTYAGNIVTAFFSNTTEIIPLTLSWTGFQGGEQISLRVAAVPLPAGLLLLGSALGGLGLARRRRKLVA